jgi:uncharacterized protein (TIGR03083 family)
MKLAPRYDAQPVISIDGPPDDQLAPVARQRRRMETTLAALPDNEWHAASRCDGWSVQDVIAHVVTVNAFWEASIRAGLAGNPTRVLATFDPAATPPLMVEPMRALQPAEVLAQFVSTNDGFLGVLTDLDESGWATFAESPPGHVPIRELAHHALWDTWIHERDIALPLGLTPPVETDEVLSSLRYAAALGPAILLNAGGNAAGVFGVEATDPDLSLTLVIGESVVVHDRAAPDNAPCLRGRAVDLVEALSVRSPLPTSTPPEWRDLVAGLQDLFDTPVSAR